MSYSLCSRAQLGNLLSTDRPLTLFDYIQVMDTTNNLRHHSLSSVCFPLQDNEDIATIQQFSRWSREKMLPLLVHLEDDLYRLALVMMKWWQTASALGISDRDFQRNLTNGVYSVETVSFVDGKGKRIPVGELAEIVFSSSSSSSPFPNLNDMLNRFRARLRVCTVGCAADNMSVPVCAMLGSVMCVMVRMMQ